MRYYTNFQQSGSKFLVTGYDTTGKKKFEKVSYKPYHFIQTPEKNEYTTLDGNYAGKIDFDSIWDARDFLKKNEGIKIFGSEKYLYNYIYDNFDKSYNRDFIRVGFLDIECLPPSGGGFPKAETASEEITCIAWIENDQAHLFSTKDLDLTDERLSLYDTKKYIYVDEHALLRGFLAWWTSNYPDIYSGWHTEPFDMPYLYNRIKNLLGKSQADKMSPFGEVEVREFTKFGKTQVELNIAGLTGLDYMDLYKRFSYNPQESYSLEHIAQEELGEGKLEYEYDGFREFWQKDPQSYMVYNIRDAWLVNKLDKKMKLIDLVIDFAHDSRINYRDTFATVLPWDVTCTNYLMDKKIVVSATKEMVQDRDIMGGYVKDITKPGLKPWIVAFDANSLYPHIMMYLNISPETRIRRRDDDITIDSILQGNADLSASKAMNASVSAIGAYFSNNKQGFLPEILETLYANRKAAKETMFEWEEKLEHCDDSEKEAIEAQVSKYNNIQQNMKIKANALFGACANFGFRHFHPDIAESITATGQLLIRTAAAALNDLLNKQLKTVDVEYVYYTDTDSVFVSMEKVVEKYMKPDATMHEIADFILKLGKQVLNPELVKAMAELGDKLNAFKPEKIAFKLEKIATNSIFMGKKKYALNLIQKESIRYDKPKVAVTGLEAVRSSTPKVVKDKIKKAYSIIMEEPEEALHEYVAQFKEEFFQMDFEKVAFPRGVNDMEKSLSKNRNSLYLSGTPIHVRASILYNYLLEKHDVAGKYRPIASGDKIKFIYLKLPNPIGENVIASPSGYIPKEFDLDKYIDYEEQFDKTFRNPIESIVSCIGRSTEKKATLESFFG